jgi:predicted amidohydrolase YtcJ
MGPIIFTNGKFYTTENGKDVEFKSCMIAKDGLIEHVGQETDAKVIAARQHGAEVCDLDGRTILPGFLDSHIHILLMGESLQRHSLERCKNLDDIRVEIRQYAVTHPELPRIVCRGWMHIMTDGRAEARMLDDLDARPVYIISKDLHSCWCNSAALRELDVDSTPSPPGGEIHRDEQGTLIGLLSESAVWMVFAKLTQMASLEDRVTAIRTAISELHKSGYTGFVDMAMDELIWEGLLALRKAEGGSLPMHIACHWLVTPRSTPEENLAQVQRAIELHKTFNLDTSPDLRIAGIKIITDGVIDACTAALHEPYLTLGSTPQTLWTTPELEPVVRAADAAGLQCALHAIGDAAVSLAITVLEKHGTPGRRHRIEHLELTRPGDAERLAAANITASVQPVHADPAILRAWPKLLGKQRCGRAFAYAEFAEAGAPMAMGSDSPTAPWDPLRNLYTATTRRSAREPELLDTMNEQFKLDLCRAVVAATAGTARSCFADGHTGRLEAGMKADFVVIDMEWKAEELLRARVEQTWFGGRKVSDLNAISNGNATGAAVRTIGTIT